MYTPLPPSCSRYSGYCLCCGPSSPYGANTYERSCGSSSFRHLPVPCATADMLHQVNSIHCTKRSVGSSTTALSTLRRGQTSVKGYHGQLLGKLHLSFPHGRLGIWGTAILKKQCSLSLIRKSFLCIGVLPVLRTYFSYQFI